MNLVLDGFAILERSSEWDSKSYREKRLFMLAKEVIPLYHKVTITTVSYNLDVDLNFYLVVIGHEVFGRRLACFFFQWHFLACQPQTQLKIFPTHIHDVALRMGAKPEIILHPFPSRHIQVKNFLEASQGSMILTKNHIKYKPLLLLREKIYWRLKESRRFK